MRHENRWIGAENSCCEQGLRSPTLGDPHPPLQSARRQKGSPRVLWGCAERTRRIPSDLDMKDALSPGVYWDREVTTPVTPPERSWMANSIVRDYINFSISGDSNLWPLDWFERRVSRRRFDSVLSIGCGAGALERDLMRRGLAVTIDAFDGSEKSIELARRAAQEQHLDGINYFVADFNAVTLPPRAYDLVCFHQSLHHVANLERLLESVRRSLRPGGLLYLDEFVGPSRTYWTERRIRWYRALYEFFPRGVRYFDSFEMPIQHEDPSEAIRSADIMSRVCIGFEIVEFRGYGGNILAMLFPDLVVERLTSDDVETMIRSERALIAAGAAHFHAIVLAQPKQRGLAATVARLRYHLEAAFPSATRKARDLLRHLRAADRVSADLA
jgi:SAM-dependent methyltransferase